MNTPTGHEAWFRDVRIVHVTAEHMDGLPLPFTGPDYATFYFTGIVHPEDTRAVLDRAVCIFRKAFGPDVRFGDRESQAGSTRWYHVEASLPSGLTLALVAKAEHLDGYDLPALAEDAPVRERQAVAA